MVTAIIALLVLGYIALLALLTWQASKLRTVLPAHSWAWRKAAFAIFFLGTIAQILVGVYFRRQREAIALPPVETWTRLILSFGLGYSILICFAVEQHLLHKDLEHLEQERMRGTEEDGY